MGQRRGGIVFVKVDGAQLSAKGEFTYSLLDSKKEGIVGSDGIHGYKELPVIPYIEGEITDSIDLDAKSLIKLTDATVTLELANGKVIVLRGAWYAGDGVTGSEEGNIAVRFEGTSIEEVR